MNKSQKLQEYLSHLTHLLELEAQEGLKSYREEMERYSLHERRVRGITWQPAVIANESYGFGGKLVLALERTQQLGTPHQFQVGDPVSVSEYVSGKPADGLQGTIISVWDDRMKVAFGVEELPDWMEGASLGVDRLFDEVTFKEMRKAIKLLEKPEEAQLALLNVLLGEQATRLDAAIVDAVSPELNPSQQDAVMRVLQTEDACIVHGPPGTGKTTTLVQAIKQVLNREKQVLVCAPSNTAVDLLTERLAAKGLSVLRLGNPARVGEELLEHTLDGRIAQHPDFKRLKKLQKEGDEYRRLSYQYKRKFGRDEREQRKLLKQEAKRVREAANKLEDYLVEESIASAQVITATLVGAAHRHLKKRSFQTVFIDEAGQALAPACLIPLLKSKQRLVLAGDHCQLPPTVKSQEAAKQGLEETLLETAVKSSEGLSVLLDTQYRMNEQIMGFSSRQFYQGKLRADASVASHTLFPNSEVVTFIDTAGCGFDEGREGDQGSYFNEGEAGLLNTFLQSAIEEIQANNKGGKPVSIGVISPYRGQVRLLKEQLNFVDSSAQLRIQTVDGFQGQEQDMICLSLVRSNENGQIGFLADTRRLNVALTRARKRLVVIGDSATIGQHPFYSDFLAYIDSVNAYRSAWELL